MNITDLYNFQREAVANVLSNLAIGKSTLLVAPTGSGKSVMSSAIAKYFSNRSVHFVAHRREILEQLQEACEDVGAKAHFSTIQSAHKIKNNIDVLIIDEAHHVPSKSYTALIQKNQHAKLLGLTATPQRMDGKPISVHFDAVIETPGTEDLQKMGFLAEARELSVGKKLDLSDIKTRHGDYALEQLGYKVRKTIVFGDVLKEFERYARDKQTIVYCVDVAHSKEVCDSFSNAGYKSVCLTGSTKKEDRLQNVSDFTQKKIQVITNCELFTEGLDLPGIECVVMLRPTLSLSLYLQMAGRGLRNAPGKQHCVILDHVNNHEMHGTVNSNRNWVYKTRERSTGSSGEKPAFPSFIKEIIVLDNFNLVEVRKQVPLLREVFVGV